MKILKAAAVALLSIVVYAATGSFTPASAAWLV